MFGFTYQADASEEKEEEEVKPVEVGPCELCGKVALPKFMRKYDCEGHITYKCKECHAAYQSSHNPQGEEDDVDDDLKSENCYVPEATRT